MRQATLLLAVLLLLAVTPAMATTVNIDFTNSIYAPASGQASFSVLDQGITNNLAASCSIFHSPCTLQWSSAGFGVNGPLPGEDPNEIGILEMFSSGIVPPTTVYQIFLRDLYSNEWTGAEQAKYQVNGGGWQTISASSSSGLQTINLNMGGVSSLQFTSTRLFSDFAVAGYSAEAVPEPSTLTLAGLGFGLLCLGGFRRLRRQ